MTGVSVHQLNHLTYSERLSLMKRCTTCLRPEKTVLVDLNYYKKTRRGTIKFKQCKILFTQLSLCKQVCLHSCRYVNK